MKHSPSKAMMNTAKRGVLAAKEHKVPDDALAMGRKIASGQQLSDDHVKAIASFHAGHEYDCTVDNTLGGATDMLFGGAPGAAWSAARAAALDVTSMSEDSLELGADDVLSLEIFVRDGLGEPIELAGDDAELIWAPILRSGTLATRPGPYGEKLREPLVIVPGFTSNPGKEIGLENLHANFQAGAIQHVTIPTSHENGVLENNGYIVDTKIVDSIKRPGERVLMGAHKITEPDVLGRLNRGSVANRSCGILHDYVDTETGTQYDQVLEHVALTNKPWVRGMDAYGGLSEIDLSERCVVPMTLSEAPKPVAPADAPKTPKVELADNVQWGDTPSLNSIRDQVGAQLADFRNQGEPGGPPYYYVMDVTSEKALVRIEYGDPDGVDDAWVVPLSISADGDGVQLADFAQWTPVTQEWVTDEDAAKDKAELGAILGPGGLPSAPVPAPDLDALFSLSGASSLFLAISQADRTKAAKEHNALPDGSYPIRNTKELRAAAILAASGHGDVAAAKALIRKRAKELGVDVSTLPGFDSGATKASERLQLQQERRNNQQGGAMPPTTQEALALLELSDEAKAVVQRMTEENRRLSTQLAESLKESRKTIITSRVKELQDKGFSPGFLAEYERIALADDGAPAAVLNLSEGGVARDVEHTATQLADRLIDAMPFDQSGKLALASQGNLLESPLSGRPALTEEAAAEADGVKKPGTLTGDDLLDKWAESDPALIANFRTKLADAK